MKARARFEYETWLGGLALGAVLFVALLAVTPKKETAGVRQNLQLQNSTAAAYQPPAGRSLEMQAFDRAVLFLVAAQESDGHWSAARWGADATFSGANGDLASTALATYVLLATSQGKLQNPQAISAAKNAMHWMQARLQPDGRIADFTAPAAVPAQMFSSMTLLQGGSLSTRGDLRSKASGAINYALFEMQTAAGGYGVGAKDAEPLPEMTALGAFVMQNAAMDGIKLRQTDDAIKKSLRTALKRLDTDAAHDACVLKSNTGAAQADWNATVAGLLTQVLMLLPERECAASSGFVFGKLDNATASYPMLQQNLEWGQAGEGYRALSMWFGTLSVVYLYGEASPKYHEWLKAVRALMDPRQARDGGWDPAGDDLRYGKVWRTCLHALTLILIAPSPPPVPPTN